MGLGYGLGSGLRVWVRVLGLGYGLGSGLRVWVRVLGLGYGFGFGLWFGLCVICVSGHRKGEITSGKRVGMENSGHEECVTGGN